MCCLTCRDCLWHTWIDTNPYQNWNYYLQVTLQVSQIKLRLSSAAVVPSGFSKARKATYPCGKMPKQGTGGMCYGIAYSSGYSSAYSSAYKLLCYSCAISVASHTLLRKPLFFLLVFKLRFIYHL